MWTWREHIPPLETVVRSASVIATLLLHVQYPRLPTSITYWLNQTFWDKTRQGLPLARDKRQKVPYPYKRIGGVLISRFRPLL